MKKILRYLLLLIILALVGFGINLIGQRQSDNKSNINKIQINTSFYPLYFFATEIGGDKSEVLNITPAGSEPHDYELTSKDIARIENSDILIINGGVEPWAEKVRENLKGNRVEIVVTGHDILTQQIDVDGKKVLDPHVWLDPILAKKEVNKITMAYIKKDAANTSYYLQNEKKLDEKLDQLNTKYKTSLNSCKSRSIITSHASFGYLAKEYGLKQVHISGISPDAEPSSQQLAKISKFAKEQNIKYIFFESLISPKLSETIAQEVGARTLVLDPLEGIPEDKIKQGKNYFTVMEDNLKNLQEALQCSN